MGNLCSRRRLSSCFTWFVWIYRRKGEWVAQFVISVTERGISPVNAARAVALMVGRAASADLVEDAEAAVADHVVVVAAAASAVGSHHATTATNPVTLPVSAAELVAMVETEAAIAIAAANLDTFPVIAQMVDQVAVVVTETDVSATLAVDLVTFLVTALRARTVVEMTKVEMNPATDSR